MIKAVCRGVSIASLIPYWGVLLYICFGPVNEDVDCFYISIVFTSLSFINSQTSIR